MIVLIGTDKETYQFSNTLTDFRHSSEWNEYGIFVRKILYFGSELSKPFRAYLALQEAIIQEIKDSTEINPSRKKAANTTRAYQAYPTLCAAIVEEIIEDLRNIYQTPDWEVI